MIDENAKKLLMEKNLQMKENGEFAEILKMEICGDDIAMVLVETKNGNKVWFSYRYIGDSWMFHGFMRDDVRLKKDP